MEYRVLSLKYPSGNQIIVGGGGGFQLQVLHCARDLVLFFLICGEFVLMSWFFFFLRAGMGIFFFGQTMKKKKRKSKVSYIVLPWKSNQRTHTWAQTPRVFLVDVDAGNKPNGSVFVRLRWSRKSFQVFFFFYFYYCYFYYHQQLMTQEKKKALVIACGATQLIISMGGLNMINSVFNPGVVLYNKSWSTLQTYTSVYLTSKRASSIFTHTVHVHTQQF